MSRIWLTRPSVVTPSGKAGGHSFLPSLAGCAHDVAGPSFGAPAPPAAASRLQATVQGAGEAGRGAEGWGCPGALAVILASADKIKDLRVVCLKSRLVI